MAKAEKAKGKNNAGPTGKAILYTLGLIALAFAVILISSFFIPDVMRVRVRPPPMEAEPTPEGILVGLMDTGFALKIALSMLNVLLILYLIYIHTKDYLALRSNFTLGLVAFLFSFLLYALSSLPIVQIFFWRFGRAEIFSFVPMLFSAIGLIIFAKLSNE